ncbi:MAG: cyclic nucleotide-binding domain-containing protein, partial [Verrucomicrobiota bacterium]
GRVQGVGFRYSVKQIAALFLNTKPDMQPWPDHERASPTFQLPLLNAFSDLIVTFDPLCEDNSMPVTFFEISRMTLFRGFDETFIRLLDLFFVEGNYGSNSVLFEEGDHQDHFYMIVAGEVEVYRTTQDKEIVLGTLCAGQFFGEMNLFDPGEATASVRALTPVRTLEISNSQFLEFIRQKPELAADFTVQLTETIVKRFRDTNSTLVEQLTHPENLKMANEMDRGTLA